MKTSIIKYILWFSLVTGLAVYLLPWSRIRFVNDQSSLSFQDSYTYIIDSVPVIDGCRPAEVVWALESDKVDFTQHAQLGKTILGLYLLILLAYWVLYNKPLIGLSRSVFISTSIFLVVMTRAVQNLRFPHIACDPMPIATILDSAPYLWSAILSLLGIVFGFVAVFMLVRYRQLKNRRSSSGQARGGI